MPGTAIGVCVSHGDGFFLLDISFKTMPRKSPVTLMHEVSEHRASALTKQFPDWRYVGEFLKACEKDDGKPWEESSATMSRVYCERGSSPYWEYVEGYVDVRSIYTGPLLKRDHTVLYRALAVMPVSD